MVFTPADEAYSVNRGLQNLESNEIEKLRLRGDVVLGDFIFNISRDLSAIIFFNIFSEERDG